MWTGKSVVLTALTVMLTSSCTAERLEVPVKADVIYFMTYYLAKNPPLDQRPSCIRPRIMQSFQLGIVDEERFTYGTIKQDAGSKIKETVEKRLLARAMKA